MFYLINFDESKIHDFNEIISQFSNFFHPYSSHYFFNLSIDASTVSTQDVTYFKLDAENEEGIDKKLRGLMEELDKFDTYYSIKDSETGKIYTVITTVGELDIKFDNFKSIPNGTYEKIDEIKNLITEFGCCKGFKPQFRVLEDKPIENYDVQPEIIYLFSDSSEHMINLQDYMSEKILEINPDFVIEPKVFV